MRRSQNRRERRRAIRPTLLRVVLFRALRPGAVQRRVGAIQRDRTSSPKRGVSRFTGRAATFFRASSRRSPSTKGLPDSRLEVGEHRQCLIVSAFKIDQQRLVIRPRQRGIPLVRGTVTGFGSGSGNHDPPLPNLGNLAKRNGIPTSAAARDQSCLTAADQGTYRPTVAAGIASNP